MSQKNLKLILNHLKVKIRLLNNTNNEVVINAKIVVSLEYLSIFGGLLKCLYIIPKLILF